MAEGGCSLSCSSGCPPPLSLPSHCPSAFIPPLLGWSQNLKAVDLSEKVRKTAGSSSP